MSTWSGNPRGARSVGRSVKYSTSVPSGRATVVRVTGARSTPARKSSLRRVSGAGSAPAVVVTSTSLGRSGHEAVSATARRPGRAVSPSMIMSPPTSSRLRRSPTRALCSVTEPRSAISISSSRSPVQHTGAGRPGNRTVGRSSSGAIGSAAAPPSAGTTNTCVSAFHSSRVAARERDHAAVGREHRVGDAALPVRHAARPAAGGGHDPGIPAELAIVPARMAVRRERDRGAVGGERRVGVVVLAAGQLAGRSVRHIDDEQMAPAFLPADPVEARREPSHDARRVALRRAGLRAVGSPDAADDNDPRRVGRPRQLADRAWQLAEPRGHAAVERRQPHVSVLGLVIGDREVGEPAPVRRPARALVRRSVAEPARGGGAVERRHPDRRTQLVLLVHPRR